MTIRLVKNGIFPVMRKLDGELRDDVPDTGYPLSGTIQGEGKLAGIPVMFVRTSGCNLRCSWMDNKGKIDICDTPYSSHDVREYEEWDIEDVIRMIGLNRGNISHLVISGGEPTIQPGLIPLLSQIDKKLNMHVTLETNGVVYVPELIYYVDLFSISPKLKSSEPTTEKNRDLRFPVEDKFIQAHAEKRISIPTIQKYITACMHMESYYGDDLSANPERRSNKDFQLKFVVSRDEDEAEIKEKFLDPLGFVKNEDVLVMPLGSNRDILSEHMDIAARMAIRNGWRFSPRIQIELFGDTAGT